MTFADKQARLNAKALARFGEEHQLDGGPVQGDFIKPGKTFTLSDGVGMQARVPTLIVADGDVPVGPVGKSATCEGDTYTVEEARPDGHGLTILELQKA
jgi:hypothetical protein